MLENNEQFVSAVQQTAVLALKSHQEEKLEVFQHVGSLTDRPTDRPASEPPSPDRPSRGAGIPREPSGAWTLKRFFGVVHMVHGVCQVVFHEARCDGRRGTEVVGRGQLRCCARCCLTDARAGPARLQLPAQFPVRTGTLVTPGSTVPPCPKTPWPKTPRSKLARVAVTTLELEPALAPVVIVVTAPAIPPKPAPPARRGEPRWPPSGCLPLPGTGPASSCQGSAPGHSPLPCHGWCWT